MGKKSVLTILLGVASAALLCFGITACTDESATEPHVHNYSEWVVIKDATCLETGVKYKRCEVCGDRVEEEIPLIDHNWGDWTIVESPTLTEKGSYERTCTVANHKESEEIPALSDTAVWTKKEINDKLCEYSSDYGIVKTVVPTAEQKGEHYSFKLLEDIYIVGEPAKFALTIDDRYAVRVKVDGEVVEGAGGVYTAIATEDMTISVETVKTMLGYSPDSNVKEYNTFDATEETPQRIEIVNTGWAFGTFDYDPSDYWYIKVDWARNVEGKVNVALAAFKDHATAIDVGAWAFDIDQDGANYNLFVKEYGLKYTDDDNAWTFAKYDNYLWNIQSMHSVNISDSTNLRLEMFAVGNTYYMFVNGCFVFAKEIEGVAQTIPGFITHGKGDETPTVLKNIEYLTGAAAVTQKLNALYNPFRAFVVAGGANNASTNVSIKNFANSTVVASENGITVNYVPVTITTNWADCAFSNYTTLSGDFSIEYDIVPNQSVAPGTYAKSVLQLYKSDFSDKLEYVKAYFSNDTASFNRLYMYINDVGEDKTSASKTAAELSESGVHISVSRTINGQTATWTISITSLIDPSVKKEITFDNTEVEEVIPVWITDNMAANYSDISISSHVHTWSVWTTSKLPTCTNEGEEYRECSICGDRQTRPVAATGHTPSEAVKENVVEATCTADGSYDEVVYCAVCGAEISRTTVTVAALEHNYVYTVKVEPTWTTAGSGSAVCSRCGDEKDEVTIPALNDACWTVTEDDSNIIYTHSSYGTFRVAKDEDHTHTFDYEITTAPTFTAEGEAVGICSTDHVTTTVTLAALSEENIGDGKFWTGSATDGNVTTYTCEYNGVEIKTVTIVVTYTVDGEEYSGEEYSGNEVDVTGLKKEYILGDEISFSVTIDDRYAVRVKVDGEVVEGAGGVYTAIATEETEIKIELITKILNFASDVNKVSEVNYFTADHAISIQSDSWKHGTFNYTASENWYIKVSFSFNSLSYHAGLVAFKAHSTPISTDNAVWGFSLEIKTDGDANLRQAALGADGNWSFPDTGAVWNITTKNLCSTFTAENNVLEMVVCGNTYAFWVNGYYLCSKTFDSDVAATIPAFNVYSSSDKTGTIKILEYSTDINVVNAKLFRGVSNGSSSSASVNNMVTSTTGYSAENGIYVNYVPTNISSNYDDVKFTNGQALSGDFTIRYDFNPNFDVTPGTTAQQVLRLGTIDIFKAYITENDGTDLTFDRTYIRSTINGTNEDKNIHTDKNENSELLKGGITIIIQRTVSNDNTTATWNISVYAKGDTTALYENSGTDDHTEDLIPYFITSNCAGLYSNITIKANQQS